MRRALRMRGLSTVAKIGGVTLGLAVGTVAGEAHAATINVTTASGVVATDNSGDGKCDLIEAVTAANTNTAYHGCTAGSSAGMDTIVLTSGRTYPLSKTLLPTSSVEIKASSTTPATITPSSWVSSVVPGRECLVYVKNGNQSVETRLTGVTLDGLSTIGVAGFCNAVSTAVLRRTRIKSFQLGGVRSWCDTDHGCSTSSGTSLSVLLSQIDSNTAPGNGAGIAVIGQNANLAVENSVIMNNQTEAGGGGVWVGSGPGIPTFRNSTIAGNSAFRGGGIYFDGAGNENVYVQLFDSTVAYNTANDEGGGLFLELNPVGSSRDFIISNSIVNDNYSAWGTYPNINNSSTSAAGLFNCATNSVVYVTPGTPSINVYRGETCVTTVADATLGPLMSMGGNELPVIPLLKGSVAIDAPASSSGNQVQQRDAWLSNEVGVAGGPATWRLLQRAVDGDEDGDATRDVGAFEFDPSWQGEITTVQASSGGSKAVETSSNYSRGAAMKFTPSSCSGAASITYEVPIAEFGHFWNILLGYKSDSTSGVYRVEVANSPSGPWTTLKSNLSLYTPTPVYGLVQLNGSFFFQATGKKYFKFTLTGPGSGGGCKLSMDYLYLMPN